VPNTVSRAGISTRIHSGPIHQKAVHPVAPTAAPATNGSTGTTIPISQK
jgi:hypothetical protein